MARILTPEDVIVVSESSRHSDDPYDIIQSNIDFLNALFNEQVSPDEVSAEAIKSYYVDYYLAQVNNGGFQQFVGNSGFSPELQRIVRAGLKAIGAKRNLELFEEGAALVAADAPLGDPLPSDFEDKAAGRDTLNKVNLRFFKLQKTESLVQLNARWLKHHPKLQPLSDARIKEEIARRINSLTDRAARKEQAREQEPRYTKLIRALCAKAGHKLDRITAGDPLGSYQGERVLAWHFLTDKGHFYMVETAEKAVMIDAESMKEIASVDVPQEAGL